MDRGLFVAAGTAGNLMERQATIQQNLANISTTGFKKIMDQWVSIPVMEKDDARLPHARVLVVEATPGVDVHAGSLVNTGNPLDIALNEGLYLAVLNAQGQVMYTKRGDLVQNDQGILKLPTGQSVQGLDGGEIAIPAGFKASIANDGTVWAEDPNNAANKQEIGGLMVVKGSQPTLRKDGFLDLKQTDILPDGEKRVTAGFVEQSNVSASEALTALMENSRLYELNTKLIGAFSSMDQKGSEIISNWQ